MPGEFFAQCYAVWRRYPKYMEANAKPLYEWFHKGGHLEALPDVKETVLYEVGREVAVTVAGPLLQTP
jgi:hypothetical protein